MSNMIRYPAGFRGSEVLVHSIGPNGVYAKVVDTNYDRVKVKYYDADDGGEINVWVSYYEIEEKNSN
jgi:hypothetical protein